jgi:hypothetical protein
MFSCISMQTWRSSFHPSCNLIPPLCSALDMTYRRVLYPNFPLLLSHFPVRYDIAATRRLASH